MIRFHTVPWLDIAGFALAIALIAGCVTLIRRRVREPLVADSPAIYAVSAAIVSVYGLVLSLTLAATWDRYQRAEAAIFDEANSLFTIYRTADSLAPADRDRIHGLVLAYGDAVIGNELGRGPEDTNGRAGRMAIRSLYDALPLVAIPEAPGQQVRWQSALNVLYSETISLDHARGERLLLARTGLPTGFWFVLYAGAAIAIAALVVIVPVSPRLHYAISLSAASLILLLLVLLRQLDQPYVGTQNIDEREFGDAVSLLRSDAEADLGQPPATTP